MKFTRILRDGVLLLLNCTGEAVLAEIVIEDARALPTFGNARTSAVYLTIHNEGETSDLLVTASTEIAARAELHAIEESGNGLVRMVELETGIPVVAGEILALERGGVHLMLMGLSRALKDGETIELNLHFQDAGSVDIEIPVRQNGESRRLQP